MDEMLHLDLLVASCARGWTISQPFWIRHSPAFDMLLVRWLVRTTIINIRCNPTMSRLGFRGHKYRRPPRTDLSRGHQGCRAFRGLLLAGEENPRV